MEENGKSYKISLKTMIFLIIIIVLLIAVIVMGFMLFSKKNNGEDVKTSTEKISDKTFEEKEENEVKNSSKDKSNDKNSENNKNKVNNSSNNGKENDEYIDKIVSNRGYIYDAQYAPENIGDEEYVSSDEKTYSISEIKVPFLNMTSEDADEVNSEIEELYQSFAREFKVCSENKNSFIKVDYETYVTANITSILITVQRGKELDVTNEYISYNFDLISGTKLDYSQVYQIAGISEIQASVKNTIDNLEDFNKYSLEGRRDVSEDAINSRKEEIEACKTRIYTYYQQDLLNNKLVYFLDNNLKLNIVINVVLPDDEGSYLKMVIVEA